MCQGLFFNKVTGHRPVKILHNFQEQLFLQNTFGGCFWGIGKFLQLRETYLGTFQESMLELLMELCLNFTAQKKSFLSKISSVNVTKSTGNCGFGHIYLTNPYWKTLFFVQCLLRIKNSTQRILHPPNLLIFMAQWIK